MRQKKKERKIESLVRKEDLVPTRCHVGLTESAKAVAFQQKQFFKFMLLVSILERYKHENDVCKHLRFNIKEILRTTFFSNKTQADMLFI